MKTIIFRIYLNVLKFFLQLVPTQKGAIVVLNSAGRSGSNGYLFYKYLKQSHPEQELTLVEPFPSSHLSLATWKKIAAAEFICVTHEPFKIKRRQTCIEFWHGVPLKRMGLMARNTTHQTNLRTQRLWHKKADIVTSSSTLYETLMGACIGIENRQFRRVGFPRLDAFKHSIVTKDELLSDLFHTQDSQAQVGIYMPTFRKELEDEQVMQAISSGNFFAFEDYDPKQLNAALKDQHQYLLIKLHPYEQNSYQGNLSLSNIVFLRDDYLFKRQLDLYELLPSTDFLLTDFSSIYFDYLQLNQPIIFVANYLTAYEQKRGLLLTPYSQITPGAKVKTQAQLLTTLADLATDSYETPRENWREMVFGERNQLATEQVYQALFK